MAYEGLMEFVRHLQSVPQIDRHLRHIHFVNIDRETTYIMANVMKSLYEQRQMMPSERVDKAEDKAKVDYCVNGHEPGGSSSSSNCIDGSSVRQPRQAVTESVDRGKPNTADNRKSDVLMSDDYHNNLSSVRETTDKIARQQLSSRENGSVHTDSRQYALAANGDTVSGSKESTVIAGSTAEERATQEETRDKPDCARAAGENEHSFCERHMGKDAENSPVAAANAAASDDDKEMDGLKHAEASLKPPKRRELKKDDNVGVATEAGGENSLTLDGAAAANATTSDDDKETDGLKHGEASLKPPKRRELKKDGGVGVTETGWENSSAVGAVAGDDKEETDALKHGEASLRQPSDRAAKTDDCVICLEPISDPKELDCGHTFCLNCIAEYFDKGQPKCPSCGTLFGVLRGNQPHGTFTHRCVPQLKLSGYEHHGALEITYHIPDGIQTVSNTQLLFTRYW